MYRLVVAVALLVSGCGDDVDEAAARTTFRTAYDTIHEFHLEVLALPDWPATYERPCEGDGRLEMTSTLTANGDPAALVHTLDACMTSNGVLDGDVSYLDIVFCDNGAPSLAITGTVTRDGMRCAIDAVETCGVVRGVACGAEL